MNSAWLPPGSATVHKGEPTATEIAKLRFNLTPDEERRIDAVLDDSLTRYAQLTADTSRLGDHVATVSGLMRDKGWDTPLTEVFHNDDDSSVTTPAQPEPTRPESHRLSRFLRPPQYRLGRVGTR